VPHRQIEEWAQGQYEQLPEVTEEERRSAALTVADYAAYNLWENGETLEILRALGLDEGN
jgi:hypothetical protein